MRPLAPCLVPQQTCCMPRIPPRLTVNARALRRNATPSERRLSARLSSYRPRFTRQHGVGDYVVDLACRSVKLGIEFDGSQHLKTVRKDATRTRFLESLGWKVIRFWNSEVQENPDGVAEAILLEVAARLGSTHPQPLPVLREGRKRVPRKRKS